MSAFCSGTGGNFTNLHDLSQFRIFIRRITDKVGLKTFLFSPMDALYICLVVH